MLSLINNANTVLLTYSTNANIINIATFTLDMNAFALTYVNAVSNVLSFKSQIEHVDNKCTLKQCLLTVKEQNNVNIMSYLYIYDTQRNQVLFISLPYKIFGIGKYFSLAVRKDSDVNDKFVLVKDNAFEYHIEEQNKDEHVKMCDQQEKAVPHVLNCK